MNDSPFGFETLDIPAVLATDGGETAAHPFGIDVVAVPVVLVPPGGQAPAGDYFSAGVVMRPKPRNAPDTENQQADPTEPPDDREADREGGQQDGGLPRTRFRFGTGMPPNPGSGDDPVAKGAKTWRGMAGKRQRLKQNEKIRG